MELTKNIDMPFGLTSAGITSRDSINDRTRSTSLCTMASQTGWELGSTLRTRTCSDAPWPVRLPHDAERATSRGISQDGKT